MPEISLKIYRFDPEKDSEPHYQDYEIKSEEGDKVLDALLKIKREIDPSLSFRYSCRSGICGTCAVEVNGRPVAACREGLEDGMIIKPLSQLPVEKDLIVDRKRIEKLNREMQYYPQYSEVYQTKEDLVNPELYSASDLREADRCIDCLICSDACPVIKSLGFQDYIGPNALLALGRWEFDPRDNGNRLLKASQPEGGIWQCSSCRACVEFCPKEIDPLEVVRKLRSIRVEDGRIPNELTQAFMGTYKRGNPWGYPRSERTEWTEGLNVKPVSEETDILYFVGCAPSYDPRAQQAAQALLKIFHKAGIEFGTLGTAESCCGNCIRRMGEEGLFEYLRDENTDKFREHELGRIVTTSPHCYNTFTNEYPNLGSTVVHYSQLLTSLLEEGKITFTDQVDKEIKVTYHDPCYLGRYNDIYDEPREILESIPGVKLIEMENIKEDSLCCAGGGGGMWMDVGGGAQVQDRPSKLRIKQAMETGADILITACPFCLLTFEEVAKDAEEIAEASIQVRDLSEFVASHLK